MNLYKYVDAIERKSYSRYVNRAFTDGGGNFQQVFAPCLSSKKVKTTFRKQM